MRPKAPAPTTATRVVGKALLLDRGFDSLAALGVKLQQRFDLIFGLRGARGYEPGAARGFAADIGHGGNEFEEVERDIFFAARGCGRCIHRSVHRVMIMQVPPRRFTQAALPRNGGGSSFAVLKER